MFVKKKQHASVRTTRSLVKHVNRSVRWCERKEESFSPLSLKVGSVQEVCEALKESFSSLLSHKVGSVQEVREKEPQV